MPRREVVTVSEITALRQPGDLTADAVFADPDRRHVRRPDTGKEIPYLSLPEGAVWVTAGDSPVDLARHRLAGAAFPLAGDDGVNTPLLELWLSQMPRKPSNGLRIGLLRTAGCEPADIERMLARYLADKTIFGIELCDSDSRSSVRRLALKIGWIERLRDGGYLHVRTTDVLVNAQQLHSHLHRFEQFTTNLEAWRRALKRFLAVIVGRPLMIFMPVALLEALRRFGPL